MDNKRYIVRVVTVGSYKTFGILDTLNGLKVIEEVTVRRSKFSSINSPHHDKIKKQCDLLNFEHDEYEKAVNDTLNLGL